MLQNASATLKSLVSCLLFCRNLDGNRMLYVGCDLFHVHLARVCKLQGVNKERNNVRPFTAAPLYMPSFAHIDPLSRKGCPTLPQVSLLRSPLWFTVACLWAFKASTIPPPELALSCLDTDLANHTIITGMARHGFIHHLLRLYAAL